MGGFDKNFLNYLYFFFCGVTQEAYALGYQKRI